MPQVISLRRAILVGTIVAMAATVRATGITPEDRAVNGQIPNPSISEYYLGDLPVSTSQQGFISGAVAGQKASVSWYKFVADGVSPVVFDQFGSSYGFGGGGAFSGGNNGELVLYNPDGTVVGSNEAPRTPVRGDSTLRPIPGAGDPALTPAQLSRQSDDPRHPAGSYSGGSFLGSNTYNLSQLAFVKHPQANPYSTTADWDEYGILPAGTYFLCVTGYSTYFAGIARDADTINQFGAQYPNADGPVTSSTPFGIVTFHANTGVYQINARKAGDINLDGLIDLNDRAALRAKIAQYTSSGGIPPEAFSGNDIANGTFNGLSADLSDPSTELARFDLTANHRIDNYDLLQWGRWSGLAPSIDGDTDLDGDVDFSDLLTLAKNYNRTGDREWEDGDFNYDASVNFTDLLALAKHYGTTGGTTPSDPAFAADWALAQSLVPEPTLAAMSVAGVAIVGGRRRRPRSSRRPPARR